MSAATGLGRQESEFDKLLKFASLNAKDIAAAGEESRRQIQLTEAEQAKMKEARDFIAKYESLAAGLAQREAALADSRAAHEMSISDFSKHVASENTRLEAFSASLDTRDKSSAETVRKAEQAAKEIASIRTDHDRVHKDAMAGVKTTADANIEIGRQLVAEKDRLKEWENVLKAKAERIRQAAANF